jgi:hypothetical protein
LQQQPGAVLLVSTDESVVLSGGDLGKQFIAARPEFAHDLGVEIRCY